MVGVLSEAQLQEEMLAALKVSVFPAAAAACAEVCLRHLGALRGEVIRTKHGQTDSARGYQQPLHGRGARSASPLMRALDFTRSTDNLSSNVGIESVPHEAKLVIHRVRQAVLRSGHSHEQVFHRFCRAGGGDALAPLMTWSDFLRVIETFERDLEPSVVVRLWQVLVPGGNSGMDFASFKKWFCQDDNALKITQEIGQFSFSSELSAFSRLMEPAPAAEWRPSGGRPPLSPLFAPGGRQSFGVPEPPKRLSTTLPVPLKDAMAIEAEVARRAEEQRLVQQVSDAAYRVEEERAARRAAEAEVETLRRVEEQRREEDRSRRHAEVEALQREAAQRAADRRADEERARTAAEAQSRLASPQVSQLPSATPHIPKPLIPSQPPALPQQSPPSLPQNPPLPQQQPQQTPPPQIPQQAPQSLPQNPPLPQQQPQQTPAPQNPPLPQQPTALAPRPPGPALPQSPPLPQQPPLQPMQQTPAPLPTSPPLPAPMPQSPPLPKPLSALPQQPAPFPQSPPLPQQPPQLPTALPQQPPAPMPQQPTLPQQPLQQPTGLPQQPPAPLPQSPPLPQQPLAPAPLAPSASSSTPAAPQSGQTAALDASGFAGAVASGKDMDVQAFVGRLVHHLGCKIAPGKYSTLTQLAGEWAAQVRQYNCVVASISPIFDNMTARIRQDSQTPGSWVTGTNTPAQTQLPSSPPAPLAPTPLGSQQRPGSPPLAPYGSPPLQPLSAGTAPAPLAQGPPQSLAPPGAPRPLAPPGSAPPGSPGTTSPPLPLQPLGVGTAPAPLTPAPLQPLTSGTAPAPLQPLTAGTAPAPLQPLGALGAPAPLAPLGSTQPSIGSTSPAPLAPVGAPAPLAPVGAPMQPLAATSSPLSPLGPPAPLAPLGGGSSAAPQSGQTASMDAAGFAGAVASGKDMDVQAFVGRLVNHLGFKIAPGKFSTLSQLAGEWAAQVRQQNCVVENVRPLYDNMVSRIRQDSQTPGSWVTGSSSSPPPPAPLQPLSADPLQPLAPLQPLTSSPPAPTPSSSSTAPLAPLSAGSPTPLAPVGSPPLQPLAPTPLSPTGAPMALGPTPLQPLAPTPLAQPPLGGGSPASPLSGQTAPLDASGFAGAVASGKDADVQAFVGRLVYHLGCKIAPGKYAALTQLAGEWAAQVRQQNCVASNISPIYDSMVSRIKGDSQTPGSWVTSSAPQQGSSLQPATMQPLGSPPLSSAPPQAPLPLSPPQPTAPLGAPPLGQSDLLTIPASSPPVDKNAAAAQRKAELDAKMKARAQEAAEKRAAAKQRAEAMKAGNAPLA